MFERFTDRARRVVVQAQEEARLLGHGYIGPEHLLLGLLRESEGVAAQALQSLHISIDVVRTRVGEIVGESVKPPDPAVGYVPFTPAAKKVFERALRVALKNAEDHIGTGHILLGLVAEGDGVAVDVLTELGADPQRVQDQVGRARRYRTGDTSPIRVAVRDMPGRRDRGQIAGVHARLELAEARLSALSTEVDRLRNLLTQHGIDPGDSDGG